MANAAAKEYFTADELVTRWENRLTVGTLANWRANWNDPEKRRGPSFVKLGRKVLYPVASVIEWEAKNLHAANDNIKDEGVKGD